MNIIYYNEQTTLGFNHVPIYASSNTVTGTHFTTELFIVQNGAKYPIGQFDGKLDEETIKARFEQIMKDYTQRQYGQQDSVLRKDLPSRRAGTRGSRQNANLVAGSQDKASFNG